MSSLSSDQKKLKRIWQRYEKDHSPALRKYLIERFYPLVECHAERLRAKLPAVVQIEDLKNAGVLGLMDAIEAFRSDRQFKFETFSALRIRGAMLDELRSMDWTPRLVRTQHRKLAEASAKLKMNLGRPPTGDELRETMGLSPAAFARHLADATPVSMMSISQNSDDDDRPNQNAHQFIDTKAADPARAAQRQVIKEMITKGLTRAERLVVILYYYEGMTLAEIGRTLDLSESRISQMHGGILRRLKSAVTTRPALAEIAA